MVKILSYSVSRNDFVGVGKQREKSQFLENAHEIHFLKEMFFLHQCVKKEQEEKYEQKIGPPKKNEKRVGPPKMSLCQLALFAYIAAAEACSPPKK